MTDLHDYKIQKNNTYETRAYQFAYYITETRQATVTTDQLIWNNLGKLIFNPIDTKLISYWIETRTDGGLATDQSNWFKSQKRGVQVMMLFGGRSGKLKDSCCSSDIQEANARNHIQKRSYNPWGKSTESETNLEVLLCAQIGWYGWFTFCESMSPPAPTSVNQKRARSLPSCTRSVAVWTRSTGFLYGCIRRHVRIGTDATDHMEDRGTHLGPLQLSPWMPVKELAPPSGARKAAEGDCPRWAGRAAGWATLPWGAVVAVGRAAPPPGAVVAAGWEQPRVEGEGAPSEGFHRSAGWR